MTETAVQPSIELLFAETGNDWVSCVPDAGNEQGRNHREKLQRLLAEVLLSENLLILAGLGTTLCLNRSGAPQVAPTMSDLWSAAAAKADAAFEPLKAKVGYSPAAESDDIEALLSRCQLYQELTPDAEVKQFIDDTEAIIVAKCRFVDDATDLSVHESFLRRVARRSTRQPRTKIFTTNYDLCIEAAASRTRFIVVDGFSHTQPQEFDGSYFGFDFVRREQDRETPDYIPNVFHLHKMHGSVDWELRGGQIVRTAAPPQPLIVYPRGSKFEATYNQPFIEMISRFQIGLRQPNTGLLVVGIGFNDPHIWQPLLSAVRANVNIKAVFVDPAFPSSTKPPVMQISSLIRAGDSRLALVAVGFEDLVPLLPDLVAATEDERHRERFRQSGAATK